MSAFDIKFLTETGLTGVRIAEMFGHSPATISRKINDESHKFFDEPRVRELLLKLERSGDQDDLTTAELVRTSYEREFGSKPFASTSVEVVSLKSMAQEKGAAESTHECWVFSDTPLALDNIRGGMPDFYKRDVFGAPGRLLVHFVSSERIADDLVDAIDAARQSMRAEGQPFHANVFVVLTNMVVGMPHTVILNPGSLCMHRQEFGAPKGVVLVGKDKDAYADLPDDFVSQVIRAVRKAKIGNSSNDMNSFYPKDTSGKHKPISTTDKLDFACHAHIKPD